MIPSRPNHETICLECLDQRHSRDFRLGAKAQGTGQRLRRDCQVQVTVDFEEWVTGVVYGEWALISFEWAKVFH